MLTQRLKTKKAPTKWWAARDARLKSIVQIILAGAAIAAMLLAVPFVLIWALNTLFPALAIPFNLSTWFAAIVLS